MNKRFYIPLIIMIVLLLVYKLTITARKYSAEFKGESIKQNDSIISDTIKKDSIMDISLKYLIGKFDPKTDSLFIKIEDQYATKEAIYLRKEAYTAFIAMFNAAKSEGISLKIVSATRDFNYQKGIWERKWDGNQLVDGKNLSQTTPDPVKRAETILRYSSMPGTSRHHWGTDIDINSVSNDYFKGPEGIKVYNWLNTNASRFGFYQTYNELAKRNNKGYQEEKWHWSYIPLSKQYLINYMTKVHYSDLTGFKGSETAIKLNVIADYVFSINPGMH